MSFSESVSLSENFTYDTGLDGTTPGLAVGLIGVGMGISLSLNFRNYTLIWN